VDVDYIALAGPTASGKTAVALAVAQALAARLPVEIVSVDSALVYRGMDIGTAKPTPAERASVPHHLLDIRDPLHAYSAAEFVRDATRLIAEIRVRGALPLLTGGTMLYFKALWQGLDDMPPAHAEVRARIAAQAAVQGWPALHAQLARVDPATAARLAPGDSQRIQRALEVWQVTGRPLSSFHTQDLRKCGAPPSPQPLSRQRERGFLLPSPTCGRGVGGEGCTDICVSPDTASGGGQRFPKALFFSLEPTNRAWLHQRIATRFDAMLAAGLVEEVQGLRARGDLHADLPSMRCVGYRQVWEALDGHYPLASVAERGIAATRQLAKRQITWLRSMPQRHTIACDAPDAVQQLVQAVRQQLP